MNGNRFYAVRVEGANHSILWAIIDGILGWLYVIYFALFRS